MILCNLSHDTSQSTSYFIFIIHSSFLKMSRPTTLLVVVASASLTKL
ncbi:BgTH12-02338 [Blumeria graminis f. sp. triticale]|uniref:BgTH12-02338 n=1 Tax=Blumeria graminis f. sp. triticale TaxID=1689686 RepID=A0A9W4D549_BLUGR|nr:BgTH12-02338 [Blumeria graminis f. sp. triticale]